jgi:anthranilate synthase component 2
MEGKRMILMIDNYDSFTYNLVQYLSELGQKIQVYRNDALDAGEIIKLYPGRICHISGAWQAGGCGVSVR